MKKILLLVLLLISIACPMVVSVQINDSTIVEGYVWLIEPANISILPVGTRYATVCSDPNIFGGYYAIVCDNTNNLFVYGAENSDNHYPNGQLIYEFGNILSWVTVQTPPPPSDPFPGASNRDVFISAKVRGILPPDAELSQAALSAVSNKKLVVSKAKTTTRVK